MTPARGRPPGTHAPGTCGGRLAGAALAELEETGRIAMERGGRIAVGQSAAAGSIRCWTVRWRPCRRRPSSAGASPHSAGCSAPAGRSRRLCLRRLVERGALRRETRRALGLFPYERFPAGAVDLLGPARERFVPRRRGSRTAAAGCSARWSRRPGTAPPPRSTARRAMKGARRRSGRRGRSSARYGRTSRQGTGADRPGAPSFPYHPFRPSVRTSQPHTNSVPARRNRADDSKGCRGRC